MVWFECDAGSFGATGLGKRNTKEEDPSVWLLYLVVDFVVVVVVVAVVASVSTRRYVCQSGSTNVTTVTKDNKKMGHVPTISYCFILSHGHGMLGGSVSVTSQAHFF